MTEPTPTPNITREEGNRFIEALNSRALCACATRRQLLALGVPGPYLDCERHQGNQDLSVEAQVEYLNTLNRNIL